MKTRKLIKKLSQQAVASRPRAVASRPGPRPVARRVLLFHQPDGDVVFLLGHRVIAEVEEVGKLPQMAGINIFPLDNAGDSVRKSLSDLLNAGLLGGLLAVAGVLMQVLLRNPLAEPWTLGVAGGAAIGAYLALASKLLLAFGMVFELPIVEPAIVYANILVPGQELTLHTGRACG